MTKCLAEQFGASINYSNWDAHIICFSSSIYFNKPNTRVCSIFHFYIFCFHVFLWQNKRTETRKMEKIEDKIGLKSNLKVRFSSWKRKQKIEKKNNDFKIDPFTIYFITQLIKVFFFFLLILWFAHQAIHPPTHPPIVCCVQAHISHHLERSISNIFNDNFPRKKFHSYWKDASFTFAHSQCLCC